MREMRGWFRLIQVTTLLMSTPSIIGSDAREPEEIGGNFNRPAEGNEAPPQSLREGIISIFFDPMMQALNGQGLVPRSPNVNAETQASGMTGQASGAPFGQGTPPRGVMALAGSALNAVNPLLQFIKDPLGQPRPPLLQRARGLISDVLEGSGLSQSSATQARGPSLLSDDDEAVLSDEDGAVLRDDDAADDRELDQAAETE